MTFHAYQRMLRINHAYHKITNGEPVTHAAFDNGYESLSGFNQTYKSILGKAPTRIIIIPCHRVIGSNGDLKGYGGGLARKKWLLAFENDNLNPR
jgi:O-6-methylguanine DNA methyltransferase